MKNNLKQLLDYLKKNYKKLPKSIIDNEEFVIFAVGDFDGEYGYGSSDLESYGINKDGKLYWIFASGCSCDCDAGSEEKNIKKFIISNCEGDTNIANQLILFKESKKKFLESIKSHNYESY